MARISNNTIQIKINTEQGSGMIPTVSVILDTKLIEGEVGETIERTSPDEKKAVRWLKENSPINIEVKYQQRFWGINMADSNL